MSSMMPAGRTLWEVNIVFDEGRKRARKKRFITSEGKAFADGFAAAIAFLLLSQVRFPRAEIKSIKHLGVIHG